MTEFSKQVYFLVSQIPKGKVTTYKELANALGTKGYRAVGQALHRNPFAPKVPCHRVVKENGLVGGYSKGVTKKIKLLKEEGIEIKNFKVTNLEDFLFKDFKF
ncbi:MAG: MGMT family protein [Candidatus Dadabacteria bacterium]|nr:MAG: MGMT family protein [Candidatus Dadabacteria bacterium]